MLKVVTSHVITCDLLRTVTVMEEKINKEEFSVPAPESIVIIFEDGSTKVICPRKACHYRSEHRCIYEVTP